MNSLKFLDKRNDDGSFLRFKVPELNYFITQNIFKSISSYESYKILEKRLSSEYLSMFFKKKIYQDTTYIATKILINRWNLKNDKKNFLSKITIPYTAFHHIVDKLFKTEKFSISVKKQFKLLNYIKSNKWYFYANYLKFKNFFSKQNKKKKDNKKIKIGVNYVEGQYSEYRNDFFWLNKEIDINSIIYYCEDKTRLKKFSTYTNEIEKIKTSNINFIKIWKWYNLYNLDFIEKIKDEINILKPKDELEKWLINEIKILLIKINFWYCFFEDQNIKIHLNSDEYSLSNVIRQIALNKLDGCSIGKCRSVPRKIEGDWLGYYPNDIFFVWGEDSLDGFKKSKNYFKNLLISGYPYHESSNELNDISTIKKNFNDKGVNFILLIIDGSHGKNEDYYHQLFPSSSMAIYLNSFLKWILEDKKLGLIIKSKKPGLLNNLASIQENLVKARKTGRIKIVDKIGIEPKKFASIADFSIGASVDIPSSVIQIGVKGQKAIIYDFANFNTIEKELYSWGKDKTIFNDLDKLIKKLKNFKQGVIQDDLGDWSNKISHFDSFNDDKGGERIGAFISDLKFYFDKGHTLDETIVYAITNYQNKWGKDKFREI